jgi:hypothetical protein
MTLTGGKRKVNKSLKAWVAFVKRVQKEEKLNYKDAIHRAKVRKDKGEKWMVGGAVDDTTVELDETIEEEMPSDTEASDLAAKQDNESIKTGGRRKTRRRRGSSKKSRKTKRRRSRRH